MNNTKHTAEPWTTDITTSYCRIAADGQDIGRMQAGILTSDKDEANAARAVACVNALAGIDDPAAALAKAREHARAIITEAEDIGAAFRNERVEILEYARMIIRALGG